jgi:hypothetical protein
MKHQDWGDVCGLIATFARLQPCEPSICLVVALHWLKPQRRCQSSSGIDPVRIGKTSRSSKDVFYGERLNG